MRILNFGSVNIDHVYGAEPNCHQITQGRIYEK